MKTRAGARGGDDGGEKERSRVEALVDGETEGARVHSERESTVMEHGGGESMVMEHGGGVGVLGDTLLGSGGAVW